MQLLDVILAFALTLAALATVVTIIMETFLRAFRMRRKNLLELMKLLNAELGENGPLGLSEKERWIFLNKVLRNPAGAATEIDLGDRTLKDVMEKLSLRKLGGTTYDKVSLEHVLRRLVEIPTVQDRSREIGKAVRIELNRLARKFEEYGSAISAKFKRHAQIWSIGVGVGLAVLGNIDGLRIFNAYLANETLTQDVISKQEDLEKVFQEAELRGAEFDALAQKVEDAAAALEAAGGNDAALQQALDEAETALAAQTSPDAIEESARRALAEFTDLETLGVPIGWQFYPACPIGSRNEGEWRDGGSGCQAIFERDRRCILTPTSAASEGIACDAGYTNTDPGAHPLKRVWAMAFADPFGFIQWIVIVIGTGLLIGLGAPFWFDVARRLAQVRRMFKGTGSTEARMSGNDADGDTKRRDEIVDRVVVDAASEAELREQQPAS